MKDLDLPAFSPQAAPEFIDAATAKAWLENVPLANVAAAQHQLLAQMQEFNGYDTKAVSRLATLEALREAVQFVQIEQARRFLAKSDYRNASLSAGQALRSICASKSASVSPACWRSRV